MRAQETVTSFVPKWPRAGQLLQHESAWQRQLCAAPQALPSGVNHIVVKVVRIVQVQHLHTA